MYHDICIGCMFDDCFNCAVFLMFIGVLEDQEVDSDGPL
jgi:hypothetical protein